MGLLHLIRGDTESIKVRFLRDGEEYIPTGISDGDTFTLTIRNMSGKVLLLKRITHPENTFQILHKDTYGIPFGKYDYDIEYSKPDKSVVKTLVVDKVVISKEVTYED